VKAVLAEVKDAKEGYIGIGGGLELTGAEETGGSGEQVVHLVNPTVVAKAAILTVFGVVAGAVLDVHVVGDGVAQGLDLVQQVLGVVQPHRLGHQRAGTLRH